MSIRPIQPGSTPGLTDPVKSSPPSSPVAHAPPQGFLPQDVQTGGSRTDSFLNRAKTPQPNDPVKHAEYEPMTELDRRIEQQSRKFENLEAGKRLVRYFREEGRIFSSSRKTSRPGVPTAGDTRHELPANRDPVIKAFGQFLADDAQGNTRIEVKLSTRKARRIPLKTAMKHIHAGLSIWAIQEFNPQSLRELGQHTRAILAAMKSSFPQEYLKAEAQMQSLHGTSDKMSLASLSEAAMQSIADFYPEGNRPDYTRFFACAYCVTKFVDRIESHSQPG